MKPIYTIAAAIVASTHACQLYLHLAGGSNKQTAIIKPGRNQKKCNSAPQNSRLTRVTPHWVAHNSLGVFTKPKLIMTRANSL